MKFEGNICNICKYSKSTTIGSSNKGIISCQYGWNITAILNCLKQKSISQEEMGFNIDFLASHCKLLSKLKQDLVIDVQT